MIESPEVVKRGNISPEKRLSKVSIRDAIGDLFIIKQNDSDKGNSPGKKFVSRIFSARKTAGIVATATDQINQKMRRKSVMVPRKSIHADLLTPDN